MNVKSLIDSVKISLVALHLENKIRFDSVLRFQLRIA